MPWLLRAEAWDPDVPGLVTRYFSDVGVVSGPGDAPAHTYWVRRIDVPPSLVRAAWSGVRVGGRGEAAIGTVTLANADGALDDLAGLEFAGHVVEVRYTANPRPALSDFAILLVAVSRFVTVGNEVVFTLADRRDLADVPYQSRRFAGTGGAEGGADWTDVRKPRALGICWQVEPDEVDEANLLFAVGDGQPIGGVMTLRDQGLPLRRGGNFSDVSGLLAAAFGASGWHTADALALLRLRGQPARPVTADILGRVEGASLVGNGFFGNVSQLDGWTVGAGWFHDGVNPRAQKAAGTASELTTVIATEPGAWYAFRITSVRSSGGGVLAMVADGVTLVPDISGDLRRVAVFQAAASTATIGGAADADWAGSVDDAAVFHLLARAGDMLQRILLDDTPFTLSDIEVADIAALNAAQPAALGLYTRAGEERVVPEVLDEICTTVGAFWYVDSATSRFRVRRWEAPGAHDHELGPRQILRLEPLPAELRLREQVIEAARRWRPLAAEELAGVVQGADGATRRSLTTGSYPVAAISADTAAQAKLWRDERLASLFAYPDAAQAEADRLVALFGVARRGFELEAEDIDALDVGQTVRVTWPRWGLSAGRDFRVLRASREGLTRRMTLTLWG
jgi:hypothetical protein